jgi:hypothetical protein
MMAITLYKNTDILNIIGEKEMPGLDDVLNNHDNIIYDTDVDGLLNPGFKQLEEVIESDDDIVLEQEPETKTFIKPKFVQQDIQNLNFDVSNITFIDVYGSYYLSPHGEMIDNTGNEYVDAKIVEFMEYNINNILSKETGNEINIIIDSFFFFLESECKPWRDQKIIKYHI